MSRDNIAAAIRYKLINLATQSLNIIHNEKTVYEMTKREQVASQENQIDWSCKSLRRTECSRSTETIERALCLYSSCPANKNETLITYDRFSSASKGRAIIFLPLLRRSYLSYEDTIERVQPGLSRQSGVSRGNVPHFVNSQRSWIATYLRVALTRMMLPILFAIRTPMKLIHSIASSIRYFSESWS